MQTKPNHCVSALTNPLSNDIVVKIVYCGVVCAKLKHLWSWCSILFVYLCFVKWMSLHIVHSTCWWWYHNLILVDFPLSILIDPRLLSLVQLEIIKFNLSDIWIRHRCLFLLVVKCTCTSILRTDLKFLHCHYDSRILASLCHNVRDLHHIVPPTAVS